MAVETRVKDERSWPIGGSADVAWIERAADFSLPVVTEVPPVFAAYCRLELPGLRSASPGDVPGPQTRHDEALVAVLSEASGPQAWWLGYLEYGIGIDLVFDDAPRTRLFGWDFVLVLAGAEQALRWRSSCTPKVAWKGALPDLMFGDDHSWMLFTSWDERWSGVGGSEDLIELIASDPELGPRTRRLVHP